MTHLRKMMLEEVWRGELIHVKQIELSFPHLAGHIYFGPVTFGLR